MRPAVVFVALIVLGGLLLQTLGVSSAHLEQPDDAILALRGYGAWAWALAIGLICADLVLPVPAGSVIAALGVIYGFFAGGLLGSLALVAAGSLGYGLVRALGPGAAAFLAGAERLRALRSFFDRRGAWAIVLSRGLPIVPEVVSCLAGLAPMRWDRFILAVTLGSVPMGFAYAALGAGWSDRPLVAMGAAWVLPVLLLPFALRMMRSGADARQE